MVAVFSLKIMYTDEIMKYYEARNQLRIRYTIKQIIKDHWSAFVLFMISQNKVIRPTIMNEVNKIIGCQDPANGFTVYFCENCNSIKHVLFTCKSRFCNCCGVKYSNDRALSISSKLLDCSHRHVVFTIPDVLRKYFAYDRSLLHQLFDAASQTIYYQFNKQNKSEDFTPGMVCTLHTFGRDLKWNPHIHMILTEGGIGNNRKWRDFKYINYEGLRRSWQFLILKLLKERINTPEFNILVDSLYENNQNGFYVRALPNKNMHNMAIANYIVRYIGRPAMAQSRITHYDGQNVTFWYQPHGSEEIVTETLSVFDFIKKLIIHIPEQHFRMLRYYGFYSVNSNKHAVYLLLNRKMDKSRFDFLSHTYKNWRKRISHFFFHDPLKCLCGHYYEFIEIHNPRKSGKKDAFAHT